MILRYIMIFACLFIFLTAWGCDADPGHVKSTIDKKKQSHRKILLIKAKSALKVYRVTHQKWPESLDEVQGLPKLPAPWEWIYNNKNGAIMIGGVK